MKKNLRGLLFCLSLSFMVAQNFTYASTETTATRPSDLSYQEIKPAVEDSTNPIIHSASSFEKPEYLNHYIQDNTLYIQGKTRSSLPYLLLTVNDSKGNTLLDEIFENRSSFVRELPKPADGIYEINLYQGKEQYGTYQYACSEYLQLKDGNRLFLYDSSVLTNNSAFFYAKRNPANHLSTPKNKNIQSLTSNLTASSITDYERALRIHDYLATEIYYDMDAYNSNIFTENLYVGEKVFTSKRAICSGYSDLYRIMLNAIGIPCRQVSGVAINTDALSNGYTWKNFTEPNHSWNEVYLRDEKRWMIVDVTWDCGNTYENGQYHKENIRYKYFDPTLESFSFNHKIMQITK